MGIAELDQAGAFGVQGGAGFQADFAKGIESAVGEAHGAVYLEEENRGGYLTALPRRVQCGAAIR